MIVAGSANPLLLASAGGYNLTRSLRFRNSATAYLNRTPSSNGNRKTWTYSAWLKRGALAGVYYGLLGAQLPATSNFQYLRFGSNGTGIGAGTDNIEFGTFNNTTDFACYTTASFRDPSAWYHIVVQADTTQATSSNRIKIYVNGVQQTLVGTYPTLNQDLYFNSTSYANGLGDIAANGSQTFDGYMTEINFIDGQALTPSSFGQTSSSTGVWQSKKYAGTYGTNGFYLPFTDNSALTTSSNVGLGKDFSGNGNYWTTNNISITSGATYDSMTDVPTLTSATTANYCVFNPLVTPPVGSISQANTLYERATFGGVGRSLGARGTIGASSGKFYFELGFVAEGSNGGTSGSADDVFGVISITAPNDIGTDFNAYSLAWVYQGNGNKANGSSSAYGSSLAQGDIIGVAIDMDNGRIWFSKNGTWQASGDPATGANPAFTNLAGNTLTPVVACYNNGIGGTRQRNINCGQRPFAYTPPTGFVALNTFNLPTPTIGATASTQANKYMDVSLYTGNGTTQSITNSGSMQPDLVWVKSRSSAYNNCLSDSVRGAGKELYSNLTNAETTFNIITSFNSNGFSVSTQSGSYNATNWNGDTYVGWQWKANGTGVTNTAGSITSTVSANTTSGFSIVTYTGTGANATIGHGLGVAPKMVIVKTRSGVADWVVYHASVGATAGLYLNQTSAAITSSNFFNNTAPSSTVFTTGGGVVGNGVTAVAYCFSEVAGYSKFGSYVGNASSDGTFVATGFMPRYVMMKRTDSTGDWQIFDTSRSPTNVASNALYANGSFAEDSNVTNRSVDFLSNGFKIRSSGTFINASGGTFIYMAFAENPLKYSLAH